MPGKRLPSAKQPAGVAVTDFNHDGHLDLVVANLGGFPRKMAACPLLLGNGDGSFQSARNFAAGDFPDAIAAADFNGDGNPDAVVANFGTSLGTPSISVMLGDGKNRFGKSKNIATFPQFTQLSDVTTGDFNGDGKADIAYINASPTSNRVLQYNLATAMALSSLLRLSLSETYSQLYFLPTRSATSTMTASPILPSKKEGESRYFWAIKKGISLRLECFLKGKAVFSSTPTTFGTGGLQRRRIPGCCRYRRV